MTPKFVVMFSGGIGSWASAKRIVQEHGTDGVVLLFTDVKGDNPNPHIGEDEDTYRFIDDAVAELGCTYVRLADGRDIWQVFKDRRFLGNSRQANCSTTLKQIPAKKWIKANTDPDITKIVIGIDWTETHRRPAVVKAYSPYTVLFPMCDRPYLSKDQMIDWARECGVEPPRLYSLGFSHNNCGGGCVRSGQGQFRRLMEIMPERYAVWAEKEQEVREHLGKDVTILSEMRQGQKLNLTLNELRRRNQSEVDMLDIGGCGCFLDDFSLGSDDEREAEVD
jgi:hypothetical protein